MQLFGSRTTFSKGVFDSIFLELFLSEPDSGCEFLKRPVFISSLVLLVLLCPGYGAKVLVFIREDRSRTLICSQYDEAFSFQR